ncbi:MAG TPA: hypothetical protein VN408_17145, partial [Actinoplanes sp.]|nr:hypothetical protein [Actinoplanes sp.]
MKKTWVRKTLSVGVLAAGALLLAPAAAALADTDRLGLDSLGGLTGNLPVSAPATLPLDPCGNVLGILGAATGVCAEDIASAQPIESGTIKPSRKQIETRPARQEKTGHNKKRTESGSTFFPGLGGLGGFYGGGGCGSSYAVFGYSSGFGGCSNTIVHRKRTKWVKRVVPVYTPGYVIGGSDCGNWNVHRATAIYGVVGAYDYDDYGTCGGGGYDYDDIGYDVISNGYGYGYGYVAGCGIPVGYVNGGACGTGVGYPNGGGYANPATPVGPGTTAVPGNTA